MIRIIQESTIYRCLRILPKQDARKLYAVSMIQVALAGLDLVGVALVGILGSLAVSGVSSRGPGDRVSSILQFLHINNESIQIQALALGSIAAVVLFIKTLTSIYVSRRILFFLSNRSVRLTQNLLSRIIAQPIVDIQRYSTQQTLYTVTTGVYTITVGILGTTVQLITDSALLLTLLIGMFIVDPLISLITIFIFFSIGLLLYKQMHTKMRNLGRKDSSLSILSNKKIVELLNSYREIYIRNRQFEYISEISEIRKNLSTTLAEMSFMPNISKYVIEMTVVISALFVSGVQFYFYDAAHAVATLALFLAASTRIAPAVLRFQQSSVQIKGSLGSAAQTLEFFEKLPAEKPVNNRDGLLDVNHERFEAKIEISNVNYKYPDGNRNVLDGISLMINQGEFVAIVGESGAGKSTLLDLMIGVINPDAGQIRISGENPGVAVKLWPGAIGYVPQETSVIDASIAQNVALGFDLEFVSEDLIMEALETAQLLGHVRESGLGIYANVGENGARISGGQRQRLSIARAMLTKPKLIFFDEATSSLDGQTEAEISGAIQSLRGRVTLVVIAHRLSTIRNADKLIYMKSGKIVSLGSFDHVRKSVPDFDVQARLMGL